MHAEMMTNDSVQLVTIVVLQGKSEILTDLPFLIQLTYGSCACVGYRLTSLIILLVHFCTIVIVSISNFVLLFACFATCLHMDKYRRYCVIVREKMKMTMRKI